MVVCLKEREDKEVGASEENEKDEKCYCSACGRQISEEEYETYGGLCEECREIEIDELDYEAEHGF